MKYIGTMLTSNQDAQGDRFSGEALQRGAETAKDKRVIRDFNARMLVGSVKGVEVIESTVTVKVEVDEWGDRYIELYNPVYAVPGGTIIKSHEENGVRVIDNMSIDWVSLTLFPSDPTLQPLQRVES